MDQGEYDVIKFLLDKGEYQTEIASALGKSRSTVWRVAHSTDLADYKRQITDKAKKYYYDPDRVIKKLAKKGFEPKDWDEFANQQPLLERIGPNGKKQ